MATLIQKNVTLEEAIRQSHYKKQNTFIWRTKENIFDSSFSEEYAFNYIGVTWVRQSYSCICYVAVDVLPYDIDNNTFIVGLNSNNGYFSSLDELRKSYPRLFNVTGEFRSLLTLS